MLGFVKVGILGLVLLGSARADAGSWKKLAGRHRKVSVSRVKRRMRADGLRHPGKLLSHKYLLRLEVKGAGGGPTIHSEIVVRLRAKPSVALAKAATGDRAPNRAQLGGYKSCKIPKSNGPVKSVGRTCPVQFNGRGFMDVTKNISERNLLLVFDPPKSGTGSAVLWVASDVAQVPMWYYVLPGARGVRFGGGRVRAQRFEIDVAPAGEPLVPPAPDARTTPQGGDTQPGARPVRSRVVDPFAGGGGARPTPSDSHATVTPGGGGARPGAGSSPDGGAKVPPAGAPPARKVRPHGPAGPGAGAGDIPRGGGHYVRQVKLGKDQVRRRLVADGVPAYEGLLRAKRLVRISLFDAGRGHEVTLRLTLPGRPKRIYGNSWGRGHLGQAQAGDAARCRSMGTAMRYSCPLRFNGLGWRNLTGLVTGRKVLLVHSGRPGSRSGMILWIALDGASGRVAYRVLRGMGGKIRIRDFVMTSGPGRPGGFRPWAGHGPWRRLSIMPRPMTTWQVQKYLRGDGLVGGAMLLRHPYVVRVGLGYAGGGTGVRTEVGLRFATRVAAAVGRAWADGRGAGRAQVGPMRQCRSGMYRFLPRGWRTCPLQFANLGWRNLSGGLRGAKKILLISQPTRPKAGGMILYLAFDANPWPLLSRLFRRAGRYTLGKGRLSVEVFSLKGAAQPARRPPGQPPLGPQPGVGQPPVRGQGPGPAPEVGPGPEGEGYPGPDAPPPDDGPPGY